MLRLNVKLSEVQLLCLLATSFICERKFYARTYVKFTRQWKVRSEEEINSQERSGNIDRFHSFFVHR